MKQIEQYLQQKHAMQCARTLRTITREMIRLYRLGAYEELLTYERAQVRSLNRHDFAAVKQSFRNQLNAR